MIFETLSIYGADQSTGDVYVRSGSVSPLSPLESVDEATDGPITVRGIHYEDFALFSSAIDEAGGSEVSYLVSHYRGKTEADIVPSALVESFPEWYVTPEMARHLKSIRPSELEQFCIHTIVDYINKSFGK